MADQIFPPRVRGFRPGYLPFRFMTGKVNKHNEVMVEFDDGCRKWLDADKCRIGVSNYINQGV